jgi:hypothetical protein
MMHDSLLEDIEDEKTPVQIALEFKRKTSDLLPDMTVAERRVYLRILAETMEVVE